MAEYIISQADHPAIVSVKNQLSTIAYNVFQVQLLLSLIYEHRDELDTPDIIKQLSKSAQKQLDSVYSQLKKLEESEEAYQ